MARLFKYDIPKKWKINIKPHNKDRRHIIRQKFYPVIFTSSYDKYL